MKVLQEKCREQGSPTALSFFSGLHGMATGEVLCMVRAQAKWVTEHQSNKTKCIHLKIKHVWEKSVLYEITAETEEIAEHLAPMVVCIHRHNNWR
jgi:hypothetical protein